MLTLREMAEQIRERIADDKARAHPFGPPPDAYEQGRARFNQALADCSTCGELGHLCPDCREQLRADLRKTHERQQRRHRRARWYWLRAPEWLREHGQSWAHFPRPMRDTFYLGFIVGTFWFVLFEWIWS